MTTTVARETGEGRSAVLDAPDVALQLDRVSKSFGEKRVLDQVSFSVHKGTGAVILGRSGTGKSVTLRTIIGLVRPDSGRVLVQGEDVCGMTREHLNKVRQRIGFLFQTAALFDSITVGENVAFPLRRHTNLKEREIRDRATEKLEQVGLESEYHKMPASLSGGMRKRAGLARAMALDPPLLLVDEPSAGLDPLTTDEIDDLLASLKEQAHTTLVVVTHNIASARKLADRLVMLDDGRVAAEGTLADFERSDNPLVRAFMASENAG
jgi:phospholipid/cholesterol/gamma-HCH transport system ATP-binding protein